MAESGNSMDVPEISNQVVVEVDVHHRHCSQTSTSVLSTNAIRPKTAAERSREYRARKRDAILAASDVSPIRQKRPKTSVERSQEYRARKKDAIQAASDVSPIREKCHKTAAERSREYRARKSDAIQAASDITSIRQKCSKTAAERSREYRARQKTKIQSASELSLPIHNQDHNIIVGANDIGNLPNSTESETSTEYQNNIVAEVDVNLRHIFQTNTSAQNINVNHQTTMTQRIQGHRDRNQNSVESRLIQELQDDTLQLLYTDLLLTKVYDNNNSVIINEIE